MRRTHKGFSRKEFLRLGGAGLAGATLLGVAGCGSSQQGGGDVISYFTGVAETTALEKANIEIEVNRFQEEYPKYTVEREAIPPESQRDVMQTRLQSDDPPDLIGYDTGPGFGGVLAGAGLLKSLEDAYKQNGWDIYDWAKQRVTYDGTLYGVPNEVEQIIVYYNKDMVSEVPQTVDDLRQIADEIKGQGKIPFAFGDSEQWPAGHMFSIGASNVLGREGLDDILYGNGRWDTPEVVAAIELIFRDFVDSGYYPEGVNAITYDDANALFYSGEAAMNPTGTWLVSAINESVQDFEVGFFAFPSIEGSSISPPSGVGGGLFVAEEARNLDGAITWLDYMLQDDTARLGIELLNVIPAHPVDTGGLEVSELFKQVLEDLAAEGQSEDFGYNIDVLAPQNFNEVMFTGFQEVLGGSRSAEEQATALQDAWAEAKKQGNIPSQE